MPADPKGYDLVICDASYSGSGTRVRTPEHLYYWEQGKLEHYTALQKKITATVTPFIKPGDYLLYITCSVFRDENESIVNSIMRQSDMEIL